jgi:DNA replication protein DnaC
MAVALGLKACAAGYRTAFATTTASVTRLTRAHQKGRLEEKLKQLTQPKLLIIDEIGYLALDRLGANLLFQLVSRRYERGSILITSNQSLAGWRPWVPFGGGCAAVGYRTCGNLEPSCFVPNRWRPRNSGFYCSPDSPQMHNLISPISQPVP